MVATIGGVRILVICDCLLASPAGIATPRTPCFFLQDRNADQKPTYGAWLVGSIWNFTLLLEATYYVSRKFDAADLPDLIQIVYTVRKLKELILAR